MARDERALAKAIAEAVSKEGGSTYFVGGYVRDLMRGLSGKDIDIEVHGIAPARLASLLERFGERLEIGESFGIFALRGHAIDIAMPRKEALRGHGHRDFDISVDPYIGTRAAARRRDFTVNALMQNVLTEEILDPFGGLHDLERGILRHIDEKTFVEDPLRVLRAAQMAARFGFTVAEETVALCRTMNLLTLPRERVMGELEKALLQAERPSVFFSVLAEMGQLSYWFAELDALRGVPQSKIHHAEGDAFTHTMMVLDEAAPLATTVKNRTGLLLSAIAHDFGKAIATTEVNGEIHSYKHESLGLPLVEQFMKRLTGERELIAYVKELTEHHMKPNIMAASGASVKATNKLFDSVREPLALVALAKADGRGKIGEDDLTLAEDFLDERLSLYYEYMARPYVMGRDLIKAGLAPSPRFSEYLAFAHKLRLAGVEKEAALKQTLAMAEKN